MLQEWKDKRLRWNPADYSGLEMLRVPCQRLWIPDIVLYNRQDSLDRYDKPAPKLTLFVHSSSCDAKVYRGYDF